MSSWSRSLSLLLVFAVLAALPAPAAQSGRPPVKEWTFLVFLNADNNLDGCGVDDQGEMATVGSNDWLNVVTLIDRVDGPASLNYIEKGKVTLVREMGEIDMGDWRQLTAFVRDTAAAFPARHYALVIWNHGSGWSKAHGSLKGISYDDQSGNHITTAQLGEAMTEIKGILGRNLDLLCMDACLMQMFEVAWPVRTCCDFIVGSEETEPGDGYPYHLLLGRLQKTTTPAEFAAIIVKTYAEFYANEPEDDGGWGRAPFRRAKKTTQSALRADRLDAAKDALDRFAAVAMAGQQAPAIRQAMSEAQRFYYWSNMDLPHFLRLLAKGTTDPALAAAAREADAALAGAIIANGTTGTNPSDDGGWGDEYDPDRRPRWPGYPIDACGLAVYFPEKASGFAQEYFDLAFARDSRWDELVQDFYRKNEIPAIVAEVAAGRLDRLQEFAAATSRNNRDLALRLVAALNFAAFAETPRAPIDQDRFRALIGQTLANSRREPATTW
ncbi:MAG: hypothetical protein GX442_22480 [Candidatus Riflebacteria bacterium]|nr:hypothetical protein [Candidatus Riflebacteria bacterium]